MDTRNRIIDAARELFLEKGYNSTSVADILARSQVNSGSLYHFFPGKQDVLIAVLISYRDRIGEWLFEPTWRGIDDPIDKIFALLGHYRWRLIETDCLFGCPIGSLALELHEPDSAVRELLAASFRNWTAAVVQCLAEAAHRLPDDLDRRALAEFVMTAMEGGIMQARTYRDLAYFDRTVAMVRQHFDLLLENAKTPAVA
jgi:AcrR family transcriptional regulator